MVNDNSYDRDDVEEMLGDYIHGLESDQLCDIYRLLFSDTLGYNVDTNTYEVHNA